MLYFSLMTVDRVFGRLIHLDLTGVVLAAKSQGSHKSTLVLPSTLLSLIARDYNFSVFQETLKAVSYTNLRTLDIGLNILALHTLEELAENAVHLTSLKMPRQYKHSQRFKPIEKLTFC